MFCFSLQCLLAEQLGGVGLGAYNSQDPGHLGGCWNQTGRVIGLHRMFELGLGSMRRPRRNLCLGGGMVGLGSPAYQNELETISMDHKVILAAVH